MISKVKPSAMSEATVKAYQDKLGVMPNTYALKKACLLGDSITRQHNSESAIRTLGSQGFWNWANWGAGNPFIFEQNLGVSGDQGESILSRAWQIKPDIDAVFLLAGTNDINSVSSSADQATIDAAIDEIIGSSGWFPVGLSALREQGKKICLATIPPNNSLNTASDARIQVLDAVNAWILNAKTAGYANEVVDIFTPMWDENQPTLRVFKSDYTTDGIHLTNKAGQAAGLTAVDALKRMWNLSQSASSLYDGYYNVISILSQMRDVPGVSPWVSHGSGALASGWRSLNSGAGTPALVMDNNVDRTQPDFVGHFSKSYPGEKFQKLVITDAVAGSKIRIQSASNIEILGGSELFPEVEYYVESSTGLKSALVTLSAFYSRGTSPVDQAYCGSSLRSEIGLNSVAAANHELPVSSFRINMVGETIRVPENIDETQSKHAVLYMDFEFESAGSAVIYIARPAVWRKL